MNEQVAQEVEGEDPRLWEELASCVVETISFAVLFVGLDYAAHLQYSQSLVIREEIGRLVEIVPALFLLTFFVNRPNSIKLLPSQLLQFLLFVLCVATGTTLIHINATSNYLQVMNVAPGVATLWIWSVVQLDLVPALLGLIGVALSVFLRGEGESVIWWR